jgi:hypothetical protein
MFGVAVAPKLQNRAAHNIHTQYTRHAWMATLPGTA